MTMVNPEINLTQSLRALPPDWPGGYWWHWLVFTVIIIGFVLLVVLFFTYFERRALGRMQARLGPNRAGPLGLFQPIADALKALVKEDIVPTNADKLIHWLAPLVAFVPVLMVFVVVPFENGALLADLNVGILYVLAVTSISLLGIFMAGWGSSNKYSMIAAMRGVAVVVSYEIPVLLAIASVVIVAGSLSLNDIVLAQNIPFIVLQPLAFLIFFIGGLAEINRSPFDLLEADSEIVAGFHTEYSGMKFALFYLVEYAEALILSTLITVLFLAGWRGPGLPPWLWFLIKIVVVFFVLVWVRATLPRARIDQLMALTWKFLFPLALINLIITGIEVLAWGTIPWPMIFGNIAITVVLVLLWSKFFFKLGWGRVEVRTLWNRHS